MIHIHEYTEVYAGSMWHYECDPFMGVAVVIGPLYGEKEPGKVRYDAHSECRRLLTEAVEEEIKQVLDNDCDEKCSEDCEEHAPDVRTAGPFKFRLTDLKLSDEHLETLKESGVVFYNPTG